MNVYRQASTILLICNFKELLEKLRIQNRHQKIKAGVIIGYQCKYCTFLFSQCIEFKFICDCECGKAFQIELLKPCCKGNLDALQSLRRSRMIRTVILKSDVIWICLLKIIEEIIQRTRHVVVFIHITCPKHFHYHRKVLFIFRSFILQIEYQSQQKHLSGVIPECIRCLCILWRGRLEKIGHEPLHIVIISQIYKWIVAMALLHVYKVEYLYFITFFTKEISDCSYLFSFRIKDNK